MAFIDFTIIQKVQSMTLKTFGCPGFDILYLSILVCLLPLCHFTQDFQFIFKMTWIFLVSFDIHYTIKYQLNTKITMIYREVLFWISILLICLCNPLISTEALLLLIYFHLYSYMLMISTKGIIILGSFIVYFLIKEVSNDDTDKEDMLEDGREIILNNNWTIMLFGLISFLMSKYEYAYLNIKIHELEEKISKMNEIIKRKDKKYQEEKHNVETIKAENRKLNKKIEQLIKNQDFILSSVSHELRNPLNIIIGNLEILLNELFNHSCYNKLKQMQENSFKLYVFINNLIDATSIQIYGSLTLALTPTNMYKLFKQIWCQVSCAIKEKKLKGILEISRYLPKYLLIDEQRLIEIILNIILNSVKFTNEGSIKISIKYIKDEDKVKHNNPSIQNLLQIDRSFKRLINNKLSIDHVTSNLNSKTLFTDINPSSIYNPQKLFDIDEIGDDITHLYHDGNNNNNKKNSILSYTSHNLNINRVFTSPSIANIQDMYRDDIDEHINNHDDLDYQKISPRFISDVRLKSNTMTFEIDDDQIETKLNENRLNYSMATTTTTITTTHSSNIKDSMNTKDNINSDIMNAAASTGTTTTMPGTTTMSMMTTTNIANANTADVDANANGAIGNGSGGGVGNSIDGIGVSVSTTGGISGVGGASSGVGGANKSKNYLRIEVVDTGIGMDNETQAKLFRPFCKEDIFANRKFGGLGLSLYLTKKIIEKMNGYININSYKNIGSDIIILIPVETAEISSSSSLPMNKITKTMNIHTQITKLDYPYSKVLVVDDNQYNQHIMQTYFECLGLEVDIVSNGLEAFNTYCKHEEGHFLLITMDLQMPIIDGITACKMIRNFEKQTRFKTSVPIVIVTGNCHNHEKEECLDPNGEIKATFFYKKPITYDDCYNLLSIIIANKKKSLKD